MSTTREGDNREAEIRDDVTRFLRANFPQIQMHGGQAAITGIDVEKGHVFLRLGGYCDGCGLSPMTSEALQNRLPPAVEGVERVSVETGELPGGRR